MRPPRVTVLMPAWNAARFVDEAVRSILAQEFRDFELVIVDDGSTDGTPRILEQWAARDPRIVLLRNEVNSGAAVAGNVGLKAARGEYVARQDADDVALPGRLAAQVAALDADPGAVAVSMNFQFIDERGVVLRTDRREQPPEIVRYLAMFTNPLGGASQVMFRREGALQAGGYDPAFVPAEDAELYTRLLRLGEIVTVPRVGMQYRLHAGQVSSRDLPGKADARNVAMCRPLLSDYLGREVTDRETLAAIAAWRGWRRHVDVAAAERILQESFARFRSEQASRPELARALRRVIGGRLAVSALLVAGASPTNAARYFVAALRRAPLSAFSAPLRLVLQSLEMRVRRRLGSWTHR